MKILIAINLLLLISCSSNSPKERSDEDKKADLYFTQGTKELVRQEYPNALKNLMLAAQFRPNDTEIQNNLGMAYYYRKSPINAIKHISKAIDIDSKNEDAKLNLGSIYMELGEYDKARIQFESILESLIYNYQYKTHYNLGLLYEKQNQMDQAIQNYKMSIEINQNYCPSFWKLGKIYYRTNNIKQALKYYDDGTKGLCYSFFDPIKDYIILLTKIGDTKTATLKLIDAEERFSGLEEQKEIQKLKRYIKMKDSSSL